MAIPVNLHRLQSSRTPRRRTPEKVGEVLGRAVLPFVLRTADQRSALEAVVADVLPETLAVDVAVGRVRLGKMVLYAVDSSLAWVLRVQWREPLLAALRNHNRTAGIREIEVRVGHDRGAKRR
jgi:hypothetical protein